uniref:hypothetical protein RF1 n=1 Tax=Paracladopus chiangmaiensis TaxID=426329 RepID=UPI001FA7024D|nr:hypothetical protein RF1 [Paracladopus chiangmaiensis]YP_010310785.1 hypothetical protein RF1 [Paracladopus chiangmaiensis]UMY76307.1 hypothetical protein RF1 [Paracladopus chiangmaiensis]UMY76320.1 hypothetical protein RF1 [Paracladopus chiangmaiensis]
MTLLQLYRPDIFSLWSKSGRSSIESNTPMFRLNSQFILYKTVAISFVHKSKQEINQRYREKSYVDKRNLIEPIESHQTSQTGKGKKKDDYDLLVPENLLSPKRCRALRILIYFNSKNRNDSPINTEYFNETKRKNYDHILDKSKEFGRDKNKLIKLKLKFFLWPNYRLGDLACMNRYWFNTNNGSRFSIIRIHIYPPLKLR